MINLVNELLGEDRPKKYFGQNFLIDKNILNKIIKVADIKKTDNVLEVGPGLGFLTKELARKAKKVVAIEKDKRMVEILDGVIKDEKIKNVHLLCNDVLKVSEKELSQMFGRKKYRVIANLPYNITSHFLRKFLELDNPPQDMILMIQREVAERLIAAPPDMSVLSVSVQLYSEPELKFIVRPGSFYPSPTVESAIVHLKQIGHKKYKTKNKNVMEVVKLGFGQKRKQLKNNLKRYKIGNVFEELGLTERIRAQELGVEDWVNLVKKIK